MHDAAPPQGAIPVLMGRITANDDNYLLLEWLAKEGEQVAEGELLLSVESSKSVEEIEAPATGELTACVAEGGDYQIGTILAYIVPNSPAESAGVVAAQSVPRVDELRPGVVQ